MGQKVNPNGFRYGITKKHQTIWFAEKADFATNLLEDEKIREFVYKYVREWQIGQLEILRTQSNQVTLVIYTARPGVVIGENSANLQKLTKDLQKATKNRDLKLNIKVETIEKPEINAKLVAENIAIKLENRGSFRAAQKQAIRDAFKAGALGVKTSIAGRLNGVDMARTEGYSEGEMKLHTLRQNVDYATATARTVYGAMGIKVWISKGEIVGGKK